MNKSTPISQLPQQSNKMPGYANGGESAPIVQEILNEIQQQDGNYDNTVAQPDYEPTYSDMSQGQEPQQYDQQYSRQPAVVNDSVEKASFSSRLVKHLKDPIIVSIVYILLSNPTVNKLIINFIPKMLSSEVYMSYIGLLVGGIIAGVLFYAIKMVVPV